MSSDLQVNPATLEFVKEQRAKQRRRRAIVSGIGLLLVAGIAASGYFGWQRYQRAQEAEHLKQLAAEPGKLFEAVRSGEVTREQARDAMRETFEEREQEAMDGYFKTPAKDRQKYLDDLIDQMQKDMERRRAQWMANRPTTAPTTRPDRPWRDGPTSRPSDAEREARQRTRADNQSPMQRAQESEFRAAMRARMEARGINMPFGGGRGGPGGGRGGPGGGR